VIDFQHGAEAVRRLRVAQGQQRFAVPNSIDVDPPGDASSEGGTRHAVTRFEVLEDAVDPRLLVQKSRGGTMLVKLKTRGREIDIPGIGSGWGDELLRQLVGLEH